jgi:PKD repeat protein
VDYINITDSADGLDLISESISTVGSVTAYASGYNNTGNTFVGLVIVTWTMNTSAYGSLSPTSGNMTVFTGSDNGMVLITAEYAPGITDTFTIEITSFSLDYIEITDAFDGTPVDDIYLDVGGEITVYASGYNSTGGGIFIGPVDVTWTQSPNTIGTFNNATGPSTVFTAGNAAGTTTVTGTNSTLSKTDSLTMSVNAPILDSIEVRNETNEGGDAITSDEFTLGETRIIQSYYCAGYNDTAGFIGDIDTAAWTLDTAIGTVIPVAGTFTQFTAITAGTGVLMANVSGITDSITITVNPEDDTTAPSTPTSITIVTGSEAGSLVITWNANTEPDLAGYNIYGSTSATGPFIKINSVLITDITYTDSGLSYGTYYYRLTAQDEVPNESDFSSTISGIIAPPDDPDEDDDGLPDDWEQEHFGDLDESPDDDYDGDGFSNFEEYLEGSDPSDLLITPEDIDGDGLPDIWELFYFGNLSQTLYDDYDNDGYTNEEEFLAETDPTDYSDNPGVTEPSINIPPVANITATPTTIKVGETVSFNGSGSYDPDGYITSYRWDYGDGSQVVTGVEVTSHTYNTAGTYIASLTVEDNMGPLDSITVTIIVEEPDGTGPGKEDEAVESSFWWIFVIIILAIVVLIEAILLLKKQKPSLGEIQEDETTEDKPETDEIENLNKESDEISEDEIDNSDNI